MHELFLNFQKFLFLLFHLLQYEKLVQIQVKLKYRFLDDQKIKIDVDVKLDLHLLLDQKMKYYNYDQIIIIAPAKTGNDIINKIAVINTDHENNEIWS